MRARVSFCTRSTAASAVRPLAIASFEPVHPAAVIGEHLVGFENVAMFGARRHVAMAQHVVDRQPHRRQRIFEPLDLLVGILGDEVGHHDARVVQHHLAQRDAVGKAHAVERARPPEVDILPRLDQRVEIGGRDHLGENRRRGQHRLGFVLAIDPVLAVLHDQHAQRLPGPQHRHAEECAERLFAGFRPIGESRVAGRVFEAQRLGLRGDQADKALAQPQRRHVHGFAA